MNNTETSYHILVKNETPNNMIIEEEIAYIRALIIVNKDYKMIKILEKELKFNLSLLI